jgi:hypothetical protein
MSFPPGTEMFQFPGFASCTYEFSTGSPCGGVSPFGHPRINDRSHLPAAFRSVPRPSSPPGAKASTERPYHAREPPGRNRDPVCVSPNGRNRNPTPPARRTKPRMIITDHRPPGSLGSAPALLMPQPTSHTFGQTIPPRRPIAGAAEADVRPPDPIHRLKEHAHPRPKA